MLDTDKFRTKPSFHFKVPRELGSKGNLDLNLACAWLFFNFLSYMLWGFGLRSRGPRDVPAVPADPGQWLEHMLFWSQGGGGDGIRHPDMCPGFTL